MKYKTKSVLIARKKESGDDFSRRPCFISLFDENNPHLNTQGPKEVVEFEKIHKVVIKGLNIDYLLPGNDIVMKCLFCLCIFSKDVIQRFWSVFFDREIELRCFYCYLISTHSFSFFHTFG